MASTSTQMVSGSSTSNPRWTHDVFLSFRGEDTRYNFTDHLYTALVQRRINAFRDDKLRRGEEIEPQLLKSIKESRSSIVVFSKTYADSRWCLEELAKIMECRQEYGQIVLPIFYHVDPSEVRKQTGSFGEAFTKHEENWKNKVQRWREALTEAGNISGWHIEEGYELEHIKEITTTIANMILKNCKLLLVDDNLVGMNSHLKRISLGLSMESNDVRMIGICGIGGIGKTTIAEYVYNQISWGFECSSFLENVGEVYKNKGLLRLQNQLLNDILDGGNKKISNVHVGAYMIKSSLHYRKAFIVFDDVDDVDQLKFLVGNHDWYGEGSRIIITTRDRHLLTILKVDFLYEVEGLNSKEALKLFSQHAFLPNVPKEDYENLLDHVIDYCQGLPLALKVLGSLLCGKTIHEWQSKLDKLEKKPEVKIQNVLKRSFYGLDSTQKKIFLDIACFFKGEDKDFASKILDGCDLYGEGGIRVLQERFLITISHNRIYMDNLIQQMAWEIVREQHPEDPSKWSRLWNADDIYHAFISEKGMKNVETISLDLSRSKEIWFTTKIFAQMKKAFAKMKKLRLLKVYNSHGDEYKMLLPKGFEFPSTLRYLHWEDLETLPSNFHGENLVAINLKSTNIKELLKGEKHLAELKFIDLSNSEQLIKIPEFSRMPKLEKLNLAGCINFCQLHSSTGTFSEMKFLTKLNFSASGIRELPSDFWCLFSLVSLNVSENNIRCIPVGIIQLSRLNTLRMNHCPMLDKIPELPSSLRRIDAHGCPCLETLSSDATHLLWSSLLYCFKSQIQDFGCQTDSEDYSETNVVIPGSRGIPEWISHKSMGHEITIDLPKNWYEDNNFLGFALFCLHVPLDGDDDICKIIYDCTHPRHLFLCDHEIPQFQLSISHGDQFEFLGSMRFFLDCKTYSINDLSLQSNGYDKGSTSSPDPALRVAYFPKIAISSKNQSCGWNSLKARFEGTFMCGNKAAFKVESCGIHLIYDDTQDHNQQSLQLFNVKRSHDDIEDQPHHKKSRHV